LIFSSFEYLFGFLPIVLLGYVLLSGHARIAIGWLIACSLFFYAWWEPIYLLLLLGSIIFNFLVSSRLGQGKANSGRWLFVGVAANLLAIGWFKYAGFVAFNLDMLFGLTLDWQGIVLPLAISFFTFQQIAFLVDCHRGIVRNYHLLDYSLFVCFFPQLIAGPIVHHKDVIPQFQALRATDRRIENFQIGLTVILLGLFKKVVLADGLAEIATPVFDRAEADQVLTAPQAWLGALAYTFQLYFDFSGYSDMAIGAARLFGIRLPENFNSPYKSFSIIDFWRRWHITLSRFLQDYLYIPLGGNRKGPRRRIINLMLTMLLGGLWHGAGWTFVFWGGLHGLYLVINHGWVSGGGRLRDSMMSRAWYKPGAWLLCFFAVVIAWVFFRAESFNGAINMLAAMSMTSGWAESLQRLAEGLLIQDLAVLVLAMVVAWCLPNLQEWMAHEKLVLTRRDIVASRIAWQPVWYWAVAVAIPAFIVLYKMIYWQNRVTEFIYFQF
jgi:D-alanyl-lipoteichoic acid acyltransferase DltB (MBOAT superfamily)